MPAILTPPVPPPDRPQMTKVIKFTPTEYEIIKRFATLAELGGRSQIRTTDRVSTLAGDQLTAQLGEAALSKFVTGDILLYVVTRLDRNKDRWSGDNGSDLLGYQIDIKTSRARHGLDFPYNLWIREREYHAGTIYILAIVPENSTDVYLLGWSRGDDVVNKKGDRYEKNRRDLLSMEKLVLDTDGETL